MHPDARRRRARADRRRSTATAAARAARAAGREVFRRRRRSEYLVTIVRRDDPSHVVFSSAATPIERARAPTSTTGMFDLRMNELTRLSAGRGADVRRRASRPTASRSRSSAGRTRRDGDARADDRRRRAGRVGGARAPSQRLARGDRRAIAAAQPRDQPRRARSARARASCWCSPSAQRQRRLARQQMEFVAAVSHELRTPLAVICSAGENLADGVVADGAQVKRYGSLIETEGRRLGDMVERVMEFAGISSGHAFARAPTSTSPRVMAEAVDGVGAEPRDRGVTMHVHADGTLPPVAGDVDALRSRCRTSSATRSKYSPSGATVEVRRARKTARRRACRFASPIAVSASTRPTCRTSSSRSIAAGARVDAQVRGTGVGLSVVRHVDRRARRHDSRRQPRRRRDDRRRRAPGSDSLRVERDRQRDCATRRIDDVAARAPRRRRSRAAADAERSAGQRRLQRRDGERRRSRASRARPAAATISSSSTSCCRG